MKRLSVKQPWAYAILHLGKDVENRTWGTDYRGELLIHTGKLKDRDGRYWLSRMGHAVPPDSALPMGMIVGRVDLVDVTMRVSSDWHVDACFGWYLENPVVFEEPVPWKGQLGLFEVPCDLVTLKPFTTQLELRGEG